MNETLVGAYLTGAVGGAICTAVAAVGTLWYRSRKYKSQSRPTPQAGTYLNQTTGDSIEVQGKEVPANQRPNLFDEILGRAHGSSPRLDCSEEACKGVKSGNGLSSHSSGASSAVANSRKVFMGTPCCRRKEKEWTLFGLNVATCDNCDCPEEARQSESARRLLPPDGAECPRDFRMVPSQAEQHRLH